MYKKICFLALGMVFCTASLGWADTVTLQWNRNTETDLNGYNLYYGNSPRSQAIYEQTIVISDKDADSWSLSLSPGVYYFTLTALDTSGNESEYSDEVMAEVFASDPPGKPGKPIIIQ